MFAPKAQHSPPAWGIAPGLRRTKAPALKARFTFTAGSIIICSMPQSLSKVILHIIFSTKNREPWLESNLRLPMHGYLATVCRDLGAESVNVGGVADHVHIVTTLPRTLSQSGLRLSSEGRTIPRLHPLPLGKGEANLTCACDPCPT